jgi:hypothetical protein
MAYTKEEYKQPNWQKLMLQTHHAVSKYDKSEHGVQWVCIISRD